MPLSFTLPPFALSPRSESCTILFGVFSHRLSRRSFVRQSWGRDIYNSDARFKLWFIVGSPQNSSVAAKVWEERASHRDLLILHGHIEAYSSLPAKSPTFYTAAIHSRLDFRFLFKTDDDVFVSLPAVRQVLPVLPTWKAYVGYVYAGIAPERKPTSKYSDPLFSWHHAIGSVGIPNASATLRYPPYVDGIAELMSRDVAECISSHVAEFEIPSTLADVVTGYAARSLCGVQPCAGFSGGCLALSPGAQRDAWPLLPDGEEVVLVRHADRSIIVERYRGRLRFGLQPASRQRRRSRVRRRT